MGHVPVLVLGDMKQPHLEGGADTAVRRMLPYAAFQLFEQAAQYAGYAEAAARLRVERGGGFGEVAGEGVGGRVHVQAHADDGPAHGVVMEHALYEYAAHLQLRSRNKEGL